MLRTVCKRAVPRLNAASGLRFQSSKPDSGPETVFTSLNEENDPNRDAFFKYTWGTWLKNNEAERAKRETRFSIEGLAEVIKSLPQSGKAPIEAETEIKVTQLASLHEGKHHRVYRVDVDDGKQYVLRIPYGLGSELFRKKRIQSEVATMDFVREKVANDRFLVPEVHSWNATVDNPLDSQYTLMDFFAGRDTLMKHWNPVAQEMTERASKIKPVVDIYSALLQPEFTRYGSLYFTEDVSSKDASVLAYKGAENDKKELADRWRIGPTTESRFWKNSLPEDSPMRGPWETAEEYIEATAAINLHNLAELSKNGDRNPAVVASAVATYEKYQQLSSQLLLRPEVENDNLFSARMAFGDLHPINVLVEGQKDIAESTLALVDFENTAIKPALLIGTPDYVRYGGLKLFKTEDIPNYDKLSDQEKAQVNYMIAQTQNAFTFEFLLNNEAPEFINSFSPRVKRLAEPVRLALNPLYLEDHLDLSEEMIKLQQDWTPIMGMEREFPVHWTNEEFEKQAKDFAEWNQKAMSTPFFQTKGWVPQDMFEQLFGNGLLDKTESGDYEYVAPKKE
ncbi:Altered inheritance of mitochondria protein 9 [Yarrowia sp. C11]|nr:Altered inheritance of mitochondria protein 9 [Yarrowia sp. C11]